MEIWGDAICDPLYMEHKYGKYYKQRSKPTKMNIPRGLKGHGFFIENGNTIRW